MASAEAELAEAKARVELAKTNLERAKELYAADVVAKELLDTRNCEMLSSNAVLASAEAKCATPSSTSNTRAYARQCPAR